jgi:hypothetical protein
VTTEGALPFGVLRMSLSSDIAGARNLDMSRSSDIEWIWGLSLIGFVALAGCGTASSSSTPLVLNDEGRQYLLDVEPDDSMGVEAAFASLSNQGDSADLTLVGRIPKQASLGLSPWGENDATFVVVDVEGSDEGGHDRPGHDPDNCPFCKRRKAEGNSPVNSLALIQIIDPKGEVVSSDARSLLGLKENQVVVASGRAHRDPLGNIILAARAVYVRPGE